MSLAWATVAVLVLLLPGFLFFTGLYIPEKFTRDVAPRSPLGQLAGSVAVAFALHAALYGLLRIGHDILPIPAIDLELVFAALQINLPHQARATDLAENIEAFWPWIIAYMASASGLGLAIGAGAGRNALQGGIASFLIQHRWVYGLNLEDGQSRSYTFAYVLTHVRQEDRVLMYRGALKQFALTREGTFAYLVLSGPRRTYLRLHWGSSEVDESFHVIGSSSSTPPSRMLMVIEGEDVANVVFRDRPYLAPRGVEHDVLKALEKLASSTFAAPIDWENQVVDAHPPDTED